MGSTIFLIHAARAMEMEGHKCTMPLSNQVRLVAGPSLIGCFINWFLFGALIVQVYDYYCHFHRSDRRLLKMLVYGVFLVELVSTCLITTSTWYFIVTEWGEEFAFEKCSPTSAPTVVSNSTVSVVVQGFFAWRIQCLRQNRSGRFISFIVFFTAIFSLVCASTLVYLSHTLNHDMLKLARLMPFAVVWLAGTMVCDVVIAVTMVITLLQARTTTRIIQTKSILNRIIVTTIETGVLTALVAIISLLTFIAFPNTLFHLAGMYVLGRSYASALLATLNGRQRKEGTMNVAFQSAVMLSQDGAKPCVIPHRIRFANKNKGGIQGLQTSDQGSLTTSVPATHVELCVHTITEDTATSLNSVHAVENGPTDLGRSSDN
ncbi:hypothetical protein BDN72DRAFT_849324 [Pluteus cervinus]|uniref:Uncharacterized protein n=1 Tax=Pluteus cervinus TaxID=181527 RepID=A0ACD3A8V7_9AGAR|nr:hypothetical protein BDN72DRAFT_849324 [Pluteus cervinus]